MNYEQALANLYDRVNVETGRLNDPPGSAAPTSRFDVASRTSLRNVLHFLGEPQLDVPFIHVTGTNGKGSTARMAGSLLLALGRSVGLYTSPDLESVNERLASGRLDAIRPIENHEFAETVAAVALAERAAGERCSFFEALTAGAYRWFNDLGLECAVIEVGMGGTWDATNVGDGDVAVITNVELDHQEYLGATKAAIATEKSGVVKPGAIAVLGEIADPVIAALLERLARDNGAEQVWLRDVAFSCTSNRLAMSGRLLCLRTPGGTYDDVFVPLHGRHQGDNAAIALAAVEAFVGEALPYDVVAEGFGRVTNPGRMEVVARRPLTLLDGAHNPAGARAAAITLDEEFASSSERILVVGLLDGRDPGVMLDALDAAKAHRLYAVAPPSPRAMDPARLALAARERGITVSVAASIEDALEQAKAATPEDGLLLVTGSLYLVGAARRLLRSDRRRSAGH